MFALNRTDPPHPPLLDVHPGRKGCLERPNRCMNRKICFWRCASIARGHRAAALMPFGKGRLPQSSSIYTNPRAELQDRAGHPSHPPCHHLQRSPDFAASASILVSRTIQRPMVKRRLRNGPSEAGANTSDAQSSSGLVRMLLQLPTRPFTCVTFIFVAGHGTFRCCPPCACRGRVH